MRAGLPISLALHAGILFAGSIAWNAAAPLEEGRVVPVELITIDEFTDIRASLKRERAEPTPEPEPTEPMQVERAAPNAEILADTNNIAPDEEVTAIVAPAVPEISTDAGETDEVEQVAEAAPVFDLDKISALIDRSDDTAVEVNSQVTQEAETERLVYADRAREGVGTGLKMTLSELDALQSAMYQCWRMPADATDLEKLVVRLQVDMLPGGFVKDVRVIDRASSRSAAPGNPFWDVAEMRAVQAVSRCAPYDFLPPEKFDQWESLILNFRPKL
jgi:hypothetical protein